MMRRLGLDLQMLQHDLSMAWSGKLSSTLLCSEQLRRLLNQICRRVDRSLSLPFSLKKISEYYKHIPVIMAVDSMTSIHLAMIIPLIPDKDNFGPFQVTGIPQYFHNSLYTWDIESDYIAISTDQSKFVYLNQEDFETCSTGHCAVNAPIYQTQDSTSCLIRAYQGNEDNMKQNCNFKVDPFPKSVIGRHIVSHNWLILFRRPWPLTVICDLDREPYRNTTVMSVCCPLRHLANPNQVSRLGWLGLSN